MFKQGEGTTCSIGIPKERCAFHVSLFGGTPWPEDLTFSIMTFAQIKDDLWHHEVTLTTVSLLLLFPPPEADPPPPWGAFFTQDKRPSG